MAKNERYCKQCEKVTEHYDTGGCKSRNQQLMAEQITKPCANCGAMDWYASGKCKPCAARARAELAKYPCRTCGTDDWTAGGVCKRCNAIHKIRRVYRLSEEEANVVYIRTLGECEGRCGRNGTDEKTRLAIDHDPTIEPQKIRLFLCTNCNTGIGLIGDSPERLRHFADCIETHRNEGNTDGQS